MHVLLTSFFLSPSFFSIYLCMLTSYTYLILLLLNHSYTDIRLVFVYYIIPLYPLALLPISSLRLCQFFPPFFSQAMPTFSPFYLQRIDTLSSSCASSKFPSHVTSPHHGEVKQTRSSHPRIQILPGRGKLLLPSQRGRPNPLQQQTAVVVKVLVLL